MQGEYHWALYGEQGFNTNTRLLSGGERIKDKAGKTIPLITSRIMDFGGKVVYSLESALASNTYMLFDLYELPRGVHFVTFDFEVRLNDGDHGRWDYSEPWTITLKPDAALSTIGNWAVRTLSVSNYVVQVLADISIRALRKSVPTIEVGFRCALYRPAALAWFGFRCETYAVFVYLDAPLPKLKSRVKKRRPPKTLG